MVDTYKERQKKQDNESNSTPYLFDVNKYFNSFKQHIINFPKKTSNLVDKLFLTDFKNLFPKKNKSAISTLNQGITYRLWKNPFKPYTIYPLSPHSLLIENTTFIVALKLALSYFKVKKKKNNLIWKKIYYKKPNKKTDEQVDAYKFYYHKNDNKFIEYFLDQDRHDNKMNYDIKVTRNSIYFKLINEFYTRFITYEFIKKKLKSLYVDPDDLLIKKIIEEKRNWIRVRQQPDDPKKNGVVTITLSDDLLKIFAIKTHPKSLGREVDIQDIREALKKKGVVYGIDEKLVQNFIENNIYDKKVLLGNVQFDMTSYLSLYYEEYLSTSESSDNIHIESKLYYTVDKDAIILKRKFPKGKFPKKYNVLGQLLNNNFDESQLVNNGENTYFDKDGNLRSSLSGTLIHKENTFTVHQILKLKKIDIETGNIKHKGSLMVEKDIEDGMTVKVDGNIFVKGNIGAANVEAVGNIVVGNGIIGSYKAVIRSTEGSISAKYIRNSTIHCKEDLIFKTLLNDCKVWVSGKIKGDQHTGTVIGGNIFVYKGISTCNIGSKSAWKTIIQAGTFIGVMYEFDKINNEITIMEKKLSNKKNELESFLEYRKEETENLKNEIKNINTKLEEFNQKLMKLEKKKNKIYDKVEVRVFGKLYPRVIIHIGNIQWENKFDRNATTVSINKEINKLEIKKK